MINSSAIKSALATCHQLQKSSTNPEGLSLSAAFLEACKRHRLQPDAITILGSATHETEYIIGLACRNVEYYPTPGSDLEYRIIRFRPKHTPGLVQYIGMAWNYDLPAFFSTYATTSYDGARAELANLTRKSYVLRWFDGEYEYDYASGQIFSAPVRSETEANG